MITPIVNFPQIVEHFAHFYEPVFSSTLSILRTRLAIEIAATACRRAGFAVVAANLFAVFNPGIADFKWCNT